MPAERQFFHAPLSRGFGNEQSAWGVSAEYYRLQLWGSIKASS
jgi:hypothetical protein